MSYDYQPSQNCKTFFYETGSFKSEFQTWHAQVSSYGTRVFSVRNVIVWGHRGHKEAFVRGVVTPWWSTPTCSPCLCSSSCCMVVQPSGGKSGEKTCFGRRRSTRRASIAMLFRRKLMLRFKKSIEAICVWPILPPGWAWWENHFLFLDHSHPLWESKHYSKSWSWFSNCWWRW